LQIRRFRPGGRGAVSLLRSRLGARLKKLRSVQVQSLPPFHFGGGTGRRFGARYPGLRGATGVAPLRPGLSSFRPFGICCIGIYSSLFEWVSEWLGAHSPGSQAHRPLARRRGIGCFWLAEACGPGQSNRLLRASGVGRAWSSFFPPSAGSLEPGVALAMTTFASLSI
jgi:hypothetical protein